MRDGRSRSLVVLVFFVIGELSIITSVAMSEKNSTINPSYYLVNQEGTGNFHSIQHAIQNAPEGAVIYVAAGEYPEIISITKKLTLIGEDKAATIINPISERNKYAMCLRAPEIKIKNFNISNGAQGLYATGIKVTSDRIEITNCNIGNTPIGIAVWSSENIIFNCTFFECADEGIALLGNENQVCEKNKIMHCAFYHNCDGIEMQYASNNIITQCTFSQNSHTGIDAITASNHNNTILDCVIEKNKVHGIYFSASSNNDVIDCTIRDNTDGNVVFHKTSSNNKELSSDNSLISEFRKELIRFMTNYHFRDGKLVMIKEFITMISSLVSSFSSISLQK